MSELRNNMLISTFTGFVEDQNELHQKIWGLEKDIKRLTEQMEFFMHNSKDLKDSEEVKLWKMKY